MRDDLYNSCKIMNKCFNFEFQFIIGDNFSGSFRVNFRLLICMVCLFCMVCLNIDFEVDVEG